MSLDIWKEDKIRIDKLKNYNYNLEVSWESDLKDDNTIINKLIKKYDKR